MAIVPNSSASSTRIGSAAIVPFAPFSLWYEIICETSMR